MGKIIAQTFPKSIVCQVRVAHSSWPVNGIPTQLYQVLMNLWRQCPGCHVLPAGTLTIATENVRLGGISPRPLTHR